MQRIDRRRLLKLSGAGTVAGAAGAGSSSASATPPNGSISTATAAMGILDFGIVPIPSDVRLDGGLPSTCDGGEIAAAPWTNRRRRSPHRRASPADAGVPATLPLASEGKCQGSLTLAAKRLTWLSAGLLRLASEAISPGDLNSPHRELFLTRLVGLVTRRPPGNPGPRGLKRPPRSFAAPPPFSQSLTEREYGKT